LLGSRVPPALTLFVAALAVADDISSILTLATFYPRALSFVWLIGSLLPAAGLYALSRGRVYAAWPYIALTIALWLSLHAAGVDAALAGVILAVFIPTRPAPNTAALLAQAATALADLEQTENLDGASDTRRDSILGWARLNLVAASERLLSPA